MYTVSIGTSNGLLPWRHKCASTVISYSYRSPLRTISSGSTLLGKARSPVCVSANLVPVTNPKICRVNMLPNLLRSGTSFAKLRDPSTTDPPPSRMPRHAHNVRSRVLAVCIGRHQAVKVRQLAQK